LRGWLAVVCSFCAYDIFKAASHRYIIAMCLIFNDFFREKIIAKRAKKF